MGLDNQYSPLNNNDDNNNNNTFQQLESKSQSINNNIIDINQLQQSPEQFIINEIKIESINNSEYKKVIDGYSNQLPPQLSQVFNRDEYESIIDSINSIIKSNKESGSLVKYLFGLFLVIGVIGFGGVFALSLVVSNIKIFMVFLMSLFIILVSILIIVFILSKKNSKKCQKNIKDQIELINCNLYGRGIIFSYHKKSHYDCYKTNSEHLKVSFPVSIKGFNVLVQPLPLLNKQKQLSTPTYITIEQHQQQQQIPICTTPLNKSNYQLYN